MSTTERIGGVDIRHWNPRRYTVARYLKFGPRRNNFGDMLGPAIIKKLTERHGDAEHREQRALLSVGSILHFASDGDVVWGTGRNGKIADHWHRFSDLDVRAVRGPLTAEFLDRKGISAPDVYGDPGLLIPYLFPEFSNTPKTRELLVVPNLHDVARVPTDLRAHMIFPTDAWESCVRAIASSSFVISSSLHGKVIADALGVPSRLVRSEGETSTFKYDDYFLGTGRTPEEASPNFEQARHEKPEPPVLSRFWSAEPLMSTFPMDLWTS